MRASATLVAGVVVAAVAVHPEHHDKDSDAPQSTQDGEGFEHSRSPQSDYFEQKLTLCTIATLRHICQFCGTQAHRGSAAQRGQGIALRLRASVSSAQRDADPVLGATKRFTYVR